MIDATPFLMAARTADAELMHLLADLGADPFLANADNTTPLLVAAGVGTRFPGEDPGSDGEVVDNNGETAMHGVAYKLAPSAVQLLVETGAKMEVWNRENASGWTPLGIAPGIVQRDNNTRPSSPTMIDALRRVMGDAAEGRLAARRESRAAVDRRGIPADGVASRSHTAGILPRRACH